MGNIWLAIKRYFFYFMKVKPARPTIQPLPIEFTLFASASPSHPRAHAHTHKWQQQNSNKAAVLSARAAAALPSSPLSLKRNIPEMPVTMKQLHLKREHRDLPQHRTCWDFYPPRHCGISVPVRQKLQRSSQPTHNLTETSSPLCICPLWHPWPLHSQLVCILLVTNVQSLRVFGVFIFCKSTDTPRWTSGGSGAAAALLFSDFSAKLCASVIKAS